MAGAPDGRRRRTTTLAIAATEAQGGARMDAVATAAVEMAAAMQAADAMARADPAEATLLAYPVHT